MNEFCFESANWSTYFGTSGTSALELIDAAARTGFEWISFDEALLGSARSAGTSLETLAGALENAGLRALAIHAVAISNDAAADLGAAAPLIEAARELGAPYLHCGVGSALGTDTRSSARQLAARARQAGVAIAIEFLPFLPVASIAQTRDVVDACADEGAAIVVDTWHFFHGPDDWDALESLRPAEIAYVQFNDHPALESDDLLRETTQRRVLPGDGEFDLERFSRTLRELDFEGVVGLEHLSVESRKQPPAEVGEALLARARRYWS